MGSFNLRKPSSLLSSLLFCAILPVTAEYRFFEIVMPPTEEFIHFTDGYIRGPGFIDISGLKFETLTEGHMILEDDGLMNDDGDDQPPRSLQIMASSSSYSTSKQKQFTNLSRELDGGIEDDAFVLDIAAFQLTDSCAKNPNCKWSRCPSIASNQMIADLVYLSYCIALFLEGCVLNHTHTHTHTPNP